MGRDLLDLALRPRRALLVVIDIVVKPGA